MNIKSFVKIMPKDALHERYTNVVRDIKKYDKITRQKMCLEILEEIKDIDVFSSLITYDEYFALQRLLNNEYHEDETQVYRNLSQRLLTFMNFDKLQFDILDEYRDVIEENMKKIDIEKLKARRNNDKIIPAIIQSYGILEAMDMGLCLEHYTSFSMQMFYETRYYQQFYDHYILSLSGFIVDRRFREYYDEMLKAYEEYRSIIKDDFFISKAVLTSIYENGLNLNHNASKKLNQKLNEFPSFIKDQILFQLALYTHVQAVIDEDMFENRNIYYDQICDLIPLLNQVSEHLPSAMFHGRTETQFFKKYPNANKTFYAKLTSDDADTFFKIYFSLLEYTNKTYHIEPQLKSIYQQLHLPPQLIMPIRDYLFKHIHIIDDFIKKNPDHLSSQELELVRGFKYALNDIFIIMEYDDEFAYVLGKHGNFAIKGLRSTIEEVIPANKLPYPSPMILLPFKDTIVYDGIIAGPEVVIEKNMKKGLYKDFENSTTYYTINTDDTTYLA